MNVLLAVYIEGGGITDDENKNGVKQVVNITAALYILGIEDFNNFRDVEI